MDAKVQENNNHQVVHSEETHNPDCRKQPSNCSCENVSWIRASSPIPVQSVRWGLWILRHKKQRVDEIWKKITTLLSKNQLGNRAKVATNKKASDAGHFICLYTYDFEDVQDIFRVLVTLQRNRLKKGYLEYLTEENNADEIVNGEDFSKEENEQRNMEHRDKRIIQMYAAAPIITDSEMELISMWKLNIGSESQKGLVAELRKISKYNKEKIKFYNPPKILPTYSSESRPCKYDELFDEENDFHEPDCNKQPSSCYCEYVSSSIRVFKPLRVKSIHSGQWLLFPEKKNVDEVWEKVKILLAANRLGNGAVVSKAQRRSLSDWDVFWEDHVISIFVNNSEDVQDVFRVLVTLRRNHLQNTFINYATDDETLHHMFKTKSEDFKSANQYEDGQQFYLYFSPPYPKDCDPAGEREIIQLFKNNIGPGLKRGLVTLVAELKKERRDFEAKIDFYNPPRILHPTNRSLGFVPMPC
jgi:hypothetical protein